MGCGIPGFQVDEVGERERGRVQQRVVPDDARGDWLKAEHVLLDVVRCQRKECIRDIRVELGAA